MEVDQESCSGDYKRKQDDLKQMIRHAKLNPKNITTICQSIYYPNIDATTNNLKLIELNDELAKELENGKKLVFKGALQEKVVLCTSHKTYEIKEAEISNSLLVIPNLKLAQATSKSPLKSPKSEGINKSLDRSLEEEDEVEMVDDTEIDDTTGHEIEDRQVLKIFYEYYEAREIKPKLKKIFDLLQLTRYSGPENEYCIDKKYLFTYKNLLDTAQCSEGEFDATLRHFRCISIDGCMRMLEYEYEFRIVTLFLDLISENSWKLDEIDRKITVEALDGIVPKEVCQELFDIYTISTEPGKHKYQEAIICKIVAGNILQHSQKFQIEEFLQTCQSTLPDQMIMLESYLDGIGIIDRESATPCVRGLLEENLPTSLLDRLKVLFKTKEKWNLEQISPYIESFTTPQLQTTAILAKHARAIEISGKRFYVSKH